MELTPKQEKAYNFIKEFISEHSFPPTYIDMSKALGLAVSTLQDHIETLIRKGYIQKIEGSARGIKIIDRELAERKSKEKQFIPLYGNVAAGNPILAEDNIIGYMAHHKTCRGRNLFALTVKGDSMIDKNIDDRDIAIVSKQNTAKDGEIIVALIDEGATIKIFRRKNNQDYLEPANNKYKPMVDSPFTILGKVIETKKL